MVEAGASPGKEGLPGGARRKTYTVPSGLAVARCRPSGLKATVLTQPPSGKRSQVFSRGGEVVKSHSRTVPSSPDAAIIRPSGRTATELIGRAGPVIAWRKSPVESRQSRTTPSLPVTASVSLSGKKAAEWSQASPLRKPLFRSPVSASQTLTRQSQPADASKRPSPE